MIREEMSRLFTIEERHHRLLARLLLTLALSVVVFAAGAMLTWAFESGQKGGDIHGFGDAIFFSIVQRKVVTPNDSTRSRTGSPPSSAAK